MSVGIKEEGSSRIAEKKQDPATQKSAQCQS